ncbi:MAG: ABC transporter ATP-binding protein [Ruminococcaceae bacterium]|nr:ABC transporter ATP-binding protein [Oscillospiraceae bacterium]
MIIDVRNLYKDYYSGELVVPVLKDVTFSVEEGEYLAIMGPSGSGKSTLMNILGLLDQPTAGEYLLAGEYTSGLSDKQLAAMRNEKIGFVFQRFHLLPSDTALQNVMLPLTYAGIPAKQRKQLAIEALEKVGLADRLDFKPNQLSGGQQQRVAIARAIVTNPTILFADEPTGSLDSENGEQIMELFQMLNEEGVTIVMITHEREIACRAKRLLYIHDGRISQTEGGAADE